MHDRLSLSLSSLVTSCVVYQKHFTEIKESFIMTKLRNLSIPFVKAKSQIACLSAQSDQLLLSQASACLKMQD